MFNKNTDMQDMVTQIPTAQDMFLEPILGTAFYDYIQLAYSAQTLTADETLLVSHIKPLLAWKTAVLSLPFLNYNIKNKGAQSQSSDFSTSVDLTTTNYLKNELENRSEWYAERLQRYLQINGNLFPLYNTQTSTEDLTPDRTSGYDSGFGQYPGGSGYGCLTCGPNWNGLFRTYY
jgi:hypothetical protein